MNHYDDTHYISVLINEYGWERIPERYDIALRKGRVIVGKNDAIDQQSWYVYYWDMVGGIPVKKFVADGDVYAWSAFVLANSTYHALKHIELLSYNRQYQIWVNNSPPIIHARIINHDKRSRLLWPE